MECVPSVRFWSGRETGIEAHPAMKPAITKHTTRAILLTRVGTVES